MKNPVPKVAAIHDLSGFGRASLTVIIPILSTLGIQVCPVPTAILSTHTGGFKDYKYVDFTEHMKEYLNHWAKLKIKFNGIYSGFLGSTDQIQIVSDFIRRFRQKEQLVVVDPVMGDDGKTYGPIGPEMISGMRELVKNADIITPNMTEAEFLLGEEHFKNINQKTVKNYLKRLSEMGPKIVIITSVPLENNKGKTSVVAYNKNDGRFWNIDCDYIPAHFPGTGDIFTSVIVGSIIQGDSLPIALDRAVQFVSTAIRTTYGYEFPNREGVLLERVLDTLKAPVHSHSYELF